jgi:molybdopterin molybdotransferase
VIPLSEAQALVLSSCAPLPPRPVELRGALGHVLAVSVHAGSPVPPFDNSAMDGYALRARDTASAPVRLRVLEAVVAGRAPTAVVGTGEAIRIMTGAPMPDGADAVCMVEHTSVEDGGATVVVEHALRPSDNVRRAGEDIAQGDEVFGAGTVLGPAHLGVLASLGVAGVPVHPRPVVGVLSTGDEVVGTEAMPGSVPGSVPGAALEAGKIRDANRPALLAQLETDGFESVDLGVAGDDEAALVALLQGAAASCQALVSSGGVSVGDRDVVKVVLDKLGGASARSLQVAVKPAKPFAFAVLEGSGVPCFGLPGNPVSALVSYELFVRPALRKMAGHRLLERPRLRAVAQEELRRHPDGKLHLLRVHVRVGGDGTLLARSAGGQGSHQLRAMAGANALAVVPDGGGVARGDGVEVLLLDAESFQSAGSEP